MSYVTCHMKLVGGGSGIKGGLPRLVSQGTVQLWRGKVRFGKYVYFVRRGQSYHEGGSATNGAIPSSSGRADLLLPKILSNISFSISRWLAGTTGFLEDLNCNKMSLYRITLVWCSKGIYWVP